MYSFLSAFSKVHISGVFCFPVFAKNQMLICPFQEVMRAWEVSIMTQLSTVASWESSMNIFGDYDPIFCGCAENPFQSIVGSVPLLSCVWLWNRLDTLFPGYAPSLPDQWICGSWIHSPIGLHTSMESAQTRLVALLSRYSYTVSEISKPAGQQNKF